MTSLAFSSDALASPAKRSPARRQLQTVQQIAAPRSTSVQVRKHDNGIANPPRGNWWLVLVALAVHGAIGGYAWLAQPADITPPPPRVLKLNFTRPEPVKPPEPKPELKPEPLVRKPQPVQNKPVETTPVALPQTNSAPSSEPAIPVSSAPVAPPAPPAPPAPEPLVQAKGGIGYLNNPPPEYPKQAQMQGWEGRVVLLVKVGTDGRALQVDIKTSSGRKVLDDAAQRTVRDWRFAPARRGDTPVEGLAVVPIDFRL